MSKKVFIYARRSSLKNKSWSISIDIQVKEIQKECIEKWLIIEWIYKDNQSSYTAWKRDDFNQMLKELENRNIKWKWERIEYLYVYMTSRLARNRKEANLIVDLIEEENLQILSMNESYDEWLKWQKKLIDDLTSAIYESKEKSEKGKKNMDETQRVKWKMTRRPPFWYKMEVDEFWWNKMIINNDNNEAKIVKIIYENYATWNYTYKSISEYLNQNWYQKVIINKKNKTKKNRNFYTSDIENILINSLYYWKIVSKFKKLTNAEVKYFKAEYWGIEFDKEIIIDYSNLIKETWNFEPIISVELFNQCLNIREWKKWKTKKVEDPSKWPIYLFRGILKCPCKSHIEKNINEYFRYTQEEKINKKYWSKTNYYKCSWWNSECVNKSISEVKLEKQITEEFIDKIVFEKEEIDIFRDIIFLELKKLWEVKENAWKLLQTKIFNLKKDKEKYYDLYVNEDDEDFKKEHKKNFKKIKDEIDGAENQLQNISAVIKGKEEYVKDYIFYINELWTDFKNFPKIRKSKMIKSFFEYIILEKESSTKFNLVDFKLNPIFELAYNKKKVRCNVKNNNNSKYITSNLQNGLLIDKINDSDSFILNGRPTRNRT